MFFILGGIFKEAATECWTNKQKKHPYDEKQQMGREERERRKARANVNNVQLDFRTTPRLDLAN